MIYHFSSNSLHCTACLLLSLKNLISAFSRNCRLISLTALSKYLIQSDSLVSDSSTFHDHVFSIAFLVSSTFFTISSLSCRLVPWIFSNKLRNSVEKSLHT